MRYTLGLPADIYDTIKLYHILDNGVPTGAFSTFDAIHHIYDECEITGGRFFGGWFYGGLYNGGRFGAGEFYGGRFGAGEFFGGTLITKRYIADMYSYYKSESGKHIRIAR